MTRQKPKKAKQKPDGELLVIIAGAIAIGASAKKTAEVLSPQIGFPVEVLLPILLIAMSKPLNYGVTTIPSATASAESSSLEPSYRAQYVLAASRRLAAVSPEDRAQALSREQQYFNQHLDAMAKRREAASAVDRAAARYGDDLGWYAKMDSITSEECREANGKNFSVSRIPPIGWPGSVHPSCRCKPGKKHATSQTVYSVKRRAA